MKSNLALFFLLFSLFLTVFLFILNNKKSNPTRINNESELHFQKMNEELNLKLSGKKITNIICMDSIRDVHRLLDLIDSKSVLVFHFSEHDCSVCYEDEIRMLQTFFAHNSNRVIILCSYEAYKNFLIFLKTNQIHFPIYRIEHGAIEWELKDYESPYYFVLHPDLSVSDIQIPDKTFPELNMQYLDRIKRFLSE